MILLTFSRGTKGQDIMSFWDSIKSPSNENMTVLSKCSVPITLKQCSGICTVCRMEVCKNWAALKVRKALQNLTWTPDYRGSTILTFTIYTAIRKHSRQPYLPRGIREYYTVILMTPTISREQTVAHLHSLFPTCLAGNKQWLPHSLFSACLVGNKQWRYVGGMSCLVQSSIAHFLCI